MSFDTTSAIRFLVTVAAGAGVALAGSQGGALAFGVPVFGLCAAVSFAINWGVFVPSFIKQTEHYYDLTGGLTYLSVVACALLLVGTPDPRGLLLASLVAIWAIRLSSFLFLRIRRDGRDVRFDSMKPHFGRFLVAWTVQGLWVLLTAACALAAITTAETAPLGPFAVVGLLVWLLGFGIEVVADRQKQHFRSDPENRGRFITTGLWAWSRHPNYFGEIVLWIGVALIAIPVLSGWQYVTLVSPLFVTYLLTQVSGIPMLEAVGQKRWGDDPAYQRYLESTPSLIPRPPARPA
ncbi:MAG: DUF1295 domain-containing protein [Myxococcota bacterium]|nr:DUF1295 domain-containing protein [Myxococcota bacterium]